MASTELTTKVQAYVKDFMSNYDGSHDYSHIDRVAHLAQHIYTLEKPTNPELDGTVVTLAAYLHDVGDKKYLKAGEDATTMVRELLLSFGADAGLAQKVQTICLGVSYSSEIKDRQHVIDLIAEFPELAVVQDADRLDAIGAVGIGRTFLFSGSRGRLMQDSVTHFDEKLLLLGDMMKTKTGKEMAVERTQRLQMFKNWWVEETTVKSV
ncbi:hypothetical protein TD95_000454 [Thielaviopsis punctulata]|uniref:HD/PDEase domain-containing protein n=1 Tax=Thielaviopsis punctulata TaxID=72032 RepID=A0A0F4ZHY6_9PEZI|nr:hypothetical protein TD95_000454 [Thielaviopsis punctulata]